MPSMGDSGTPLTPFRPERGSALRAAPPAPSPRALALELLAFLALALALRLLLLWAPAADLLGLDMLGRPLDAHGEEYSRGTIAAQILRGPLLPLLDYQWAPGFGGSLVVGLMAIPAFLLLGQTLFALKLVPTAFALLMVSGCHLMGLALGGRAAARAAALLAAVGFPGLLAFQTIAWGSHAEVAALSALFGALSLRALAHERPPARLRLAQGLLAGFALYFGLGFALFLAPVVVLELLWRRRRLLARSSLAAVGGFAVGFLPWMVYNARHGLTGLQQYDQSLAEQLTVTSGSVAARAVGLWTEVFPRSLYVRGGTLELTSAGTWVLLAALAVPVLLAAASLVRRHRLEPGWILLAHLLLFTGASATSRYYPSPLTDQFVKYRYPMMVVPSLLVLAALGLAALWRRPAGGRWLALALLLPLVASSLLGTARLIDPSRAGTFLERGGTGVPGHGRWLVMRYADDLPLLAAALERAELRRTPEERRELYRTIAQTLSIVLKPPRAGSRAPSPRDEHYRRVRAWLAEHAPPEHRHLFGGAGMAAVGGQAPGG